MRRDQLFNPHLAGESFSLVPEDPHPVGILLFHGFTATTAEVRLLAERLCAAGYAVHAPLLPGHGTSPADLNRVSWHALVDAAEQAFSEFSARFPAVVVGGESMGALLALWLAASHPEIAGVLAYAPALDVPRLRGARVLSRFVPEVAKKNLDDGLPWQGYAVYPLRGAVQLLNLQQAVRAVLPQVRQPLLVVQGRLDQTVAPDVGEQILAAVSSQHKQLLWMENSRHVLILDRELPTVTEATLAFLRSLSPFSAGASINRLGPQV